MASSFDQLQAFQDAIDALNRAGLAYAITGSWVVSAYGILRATHDLDVVVAMTEATAEQVVGAFPSARYYVDELSIQEALERRSFFNIIDGESTLKIDFWPLKEDDYSQQQFARRVPVMMGDRRVWALTPEDIILAKLLWIKISDSERQWRDVRSVWALKKDELDVPYLKHWAARLSITDLFSKVTTP